MFILIEYNKENYRELINKIQTLNLTPVILFKFTILNKEENKKQLDNIREIKNLEKIDYSAIQITISEKIENSIQTIINSLKQEFNIIIGLGGLNKINRLFLEETQIDFLQDPQNSKFNPKIDFIHHFNSGINDILCTFAKQKQIGFLFDLNLLFMKTKYMSKEIGRVNQNLIFARKYKIPIILNFIIKNENQIKSKQELIHIMSLFNLSTKQKIESINIIEQKIKQNNFKKSQKYITEGLYIKE